MQDPTTGPTPGVQPNVKYCPNCRGDIRPVPSRNNPADTSHTYVCQVCDYRFEINVMGRVPR